MINMDDAAALDDAEYSGVFFVPYCSQINSRGGQPLPLAVWPDYHYRLVGRARLLLLVLVRFGTIAITKYYWFPFFTGQIHGGQLCICVRAGAGVVVNCVK